MNRNDDCVIIVLDQSFRSEKLSALYSRIQINSLALHFIPTIPQLSLLLRDEEELLLESFRNMEKPYIPKEKRDDLNFMRRAVRVNPKIYAKYEILQKDKEATLDAVGLDGMLLQSAPHFSADFDVVFKAFVQNPSSRQYVSWTVNSLLTATQEFKDWDMKLIRNRTEFTEDFKNNLYPQIRKCPSEIDNYINGYESKMLKQSINEDSEIMMECTRIHPSIFKLAHQSLRSNKELVLEALNINGLLLGYVDESLSNDLDTIRAALSQNIYATNSIREDLKTTDLLLEFPGAIGFFNDSFRSNRDIMMKVVRRDGKLLKHADNNLKLDRELVLEAVKQSGMSIQYADPTLLKDREIALFAVSQNGYSINYFQKIFSNDRQIIEKAIEADGLHLRFGSVALRKDRQIVLKAVSKNGYALRYAASEFQKDKEIVLLALKKNGQATEFVHPSLWRDIDVVKLAGEHSARALYLASAEIKSKKEIVLPMLFKFATCFDYMGQELRQDKEFLLVAIQQNCRVFEKLNKNLKQDEDFIRRCLEVNGECFVYLDDVYKKKSEFVILACNRIIYHLSDFLARNSLFRNDFNFVDQCVKRNGRALNYFKLDELDHDGMSIVKLAIKSVR